MLKKLKIKDNLIVKLNPLIDTEGNIKTILSDSYLVNKKFFKKDSELINVTLVYDRKKMDKILHRSTSEWEVAFAYNHGRLKNQIAIFSPEVIEKVSKNTKSYFPYLLRHEMCHVFTDNILGFFYPRWLYEGIAGYVSKQCSKYTKVDKIVKFDLIHDKKGWKNNTSYPQAYLFTKFLMDKYGEKKMVDFTKNTLRKLNRYHDFNDFQTAFKEFFKENFLDISNAWKNNNRTR